MNPKIVIAGVIGVVVLVLGAAFGLSRPQAGPKVITENNGKLEVSETLHDFGEVSMAKGVVLKKFEIANKDSKTATVTKLFTSCMCTKAALITDSKKWGPFGMPGHGSIPKIAAEIPIGGAAEVEVAFDPAAHGPAGIGQIERTVTIEQNGQEPLLLTIRATVIP